MDGTGTLFESFIGQLPEDVTVHVIRYPGDQDLTYPALIQLARSSLPVSDPYVLVAESFSTPIAIACAARRDPNLRGLVLCAGFACGPVPAWLGPLAVLLEPAFFFPIPAVIARLMLVDGAAPKSLLTAVQTAIATVRPKVLVERLRSVLTCDMRRELGQTNVPLLYIRASRDRLIGTRSLDQIRSLRPDTNVSVIDAPHLLLQREPSEAAEMIGSFVRQLA